jgi:hypothetical protein
VKFLQTKRQKETEALCLSGQFSSSNFTVLFVVRFKIDLRSCDNAFSGCRARSTLTKNFRVFLYLFKWRDSQVIALSQPNNANAVPLIQMAPGISPM